MCTVWNKEHQFLYCSMSNLIMKAKNGELVSRCSLKSTEKLSLLVRYHHHHTLSGRLKNLTRNFNKTSNCFFRMHNYHIHSEMETLRSSKINNPKSSWKCRHNSSRYWALIRTTVMLNKNYSHSAEQELHLCRIKTTDFFLRFEKW